MGDHGRYRGTIALDLAATGAEALHLLALDARDRATVLRGTWRPAGAGGPAWAPWWWVATERDGVLGGRHGPRGSGSVGQPDRGTVAWATALVPPFPDDVEAVELTPALGPADEAPGAGASGRAVAGPTRVALPQWPPVLRTARAEVLPDEPIRPPPSSARPAGTTPAAGVAGDVGATATRPERVVAVSTRLDTGRSNDPAVASLVAWPGGFDLHVTWDAHVSLAALRDVRVGRGASGWPAVDDRGRAHHGVVAHTQASGPSLDLTFVPALHPGAVALTVTLPDVTSLPFTGRGALRATLPLVPPGG